MEYRVDEFLRDDDIPETYENEVEKKISLLYDFCILHKRRRCQQRDEREKAVRALLLSYGDANKLNKVVRDIITGEQSINAELRKGIKQ